MIETIYLRLNLLGKYSGLGTNVIYVLVVLYIIFIYILIKVHQDIIKTKKKLEQKGIWRYDNIRYIFSTFAYQSNLTGIDAISNIQGLKVVFQSDKLNYFSNHKLIKTEIEKLEDALQKTIIPKEERSNINIIKGKIGILKIFENILGFITTIFTIGIYKLFW
ncbi:MAG: hypothetical protein WC872_02020 [Candidatus Absconditabacterales bacterium]